MLLNRRTMRRRGRWKCCGRFPRPGYLRKRLPQELTVLQGGQATGFATDGSAAVAYQTRDVESVTVATMDART